MQALTHLRQREKREEREREEGREIDPAKIRDPSPFVIVHIKTPKTQM